MMLRSSRLTGDTVIGQDVGVGSPALTVGVLDVAGREVGRRPAVNGRADVLGGGD